MGPAEGGKDLLQHWHEPLSMLRPYASLKTIESKSLQADLGIWIFLKLVNIVIWKAINPQYEGPNCLTFNLYLGTEKPIEFETYT